MFIVQSEVDKPDALSDAMGRRQGWQSSQDGEKLHDGHTDEQDLVFRSEVVKRKTDADAGEALPTAPIHLLYTTVYRSCPAMSVVGGQTS